MTPPKKALARTSKAAQVLLLLPNNLLPELRQIIDTARQTAAVAINMAQTQLYWHIGKRIRAEVLVEQRAQYGEQIVATLSRHLTADYGRGFEEKNLRRMIQFAECFPEERVCAAAKCPQH
jgi:hypothetical protein